MQEKVSNIFNLRYVFNEDKNIFMLENGVVFTRQEFNNGKATHEQMQERLEAGLTYDYEKFKEAGELVLKNASSSKTLWSMIIMLAFTVIISMYISTLHTATYLTDYVDVISSWLMSASVTVYNSTAFEISVIFSKEKRYIIASTFMILWIMVTVFSMVTTVSVFFDMYNFNEAAIVEENKDINSAVAELEMLKTKENDLRSAIDFKKADILYRQENDYSTIEVRKELNVLEEELQKNLTEQQAILADTPQATNEDAVKVKESLFTFLGRLIGIEGGIFEFIMSTLAAIFVNIISPLSFTALIELKKR